MTDEWDLAVDAEIEDRLIRRSERVGRDRLWAAIQLEIGTRAALHSEMMQRDMRWWYGLWTRSYASRVG